MYILKMDGDDVLHIVGITLICLAIMVYVYY